VTVEGSEPSALPKNATRLRRLDVVVEGVLPAELQEQAVRLFTTLSVEMLLDEASGEPAEAAVTVSG
jgi:hypothetical protein